MMYYNIIILFMRTTNTPTDMNYLCQQGVPDILPSRLYFYFLLK